MRLIILSIVIAIQAGFAQASDEALMSFKLNSQDKVTAKAVSVYFDLEGLDKSSYEVIVPKSQEDFFLKLAPKAQLVDADTAATGRERVQMFRSFWQSETYHTFPQVQAWMQGLEQKHAGIVKLVPYGISPKGNAFTALRLNSEVHANKPVLMITAATHGDELITTEVLIRLIEKLTNEYGTNPRLTKMVDEHDIYFVPVVNADGFAAVRRYDGFYDPNRSYPYPGDERVSSSPSVAAIIQLFEKIRPVGSIDFHAYGELVMYPWAYTRSPVDEPFKTKFETVTQEMTALNKYRRGAIASILYAAPGSSADYYFWKEGTISLGIEIGRSKIPSPESIPMYAQSQEESTWKFIESFK